MTREEQIQKLKDLKAMNLPKMNYVDIKEGYEKRHGIPDEKIIGYINTELEKFVKAETDTCLWCGANHGYQWGLLHGSAYCNDCGWEYRVYHYIKDTEDKDIVKLTMALQYHPDCFEIDEE